MGVDTILQGQSLLGTTVCVILHCRPLETIVLEAAASDAANSHAHGVKYRLKELDILIHRTSTSCPHVCNKIQRRFGSATLRRLRQFNVVDDSL